MIDEEPIVKEKEAIMIQVEDQDRLWSGWEDEHELWNAIVKDVEATMMDKKDFYDCLHN